MAFHLLFFFSFFLSLSFFLFWPLAGSQTGSRLVVAQHWGGSWQVRLDWKMKMGKLKMTANRYEVSFFLNFFKIYYLFIIFGCVGSSFL